VFKTPFPELTEVAEENGIKLDSQLSGAFNEGMKKKLLTAIKRK